MTKNTSLWDCETVLKDFSELSNIHLEKFLILCCNMVAKY